MLCFGALFLIVSLTYVRGEEDVRNSTDNIAKKVKLSETSFFNNELPTNWTKSDELIIINQSAFFNESELNIKTPLLNSPYTKYFEINVSEINNPLDGEFLVRGFNSDKSKLLEEISIPVNEVGLFTKRFSYDYIYIDQIEFVYKGSATTLSVAYLGVFSLQ
jgi:hypothetical protein